MSDLRVKPNIENGDLSKQKGKKTELALALEHESSPEMKQFEDSLHSVFRVNHNTKKE